MVLISRDEPAPLALPGIFVEGFRLSCCTFSGLSDLQAGRRRCFSFYAAKLQKASVKSKFSPKLSDAFTFFNIWEVEGGMRQNFDSFLRFEETPCHARGCVKMKESPCHVVPSSGEEGSGVAKREEGAMRGA